mmetsp:Transcript_29505/g.94745  ORF Transcript_29505/g.94745 Transcript_29505/m.94745 type:complete len:85 (+) Transcript_29505:79-333(+)
MLERYERKAVFYLSGESDVCNKPFQDAHKCTACTVDDGGFETTCGDYFEGACRMERAHAFVQSMCVHYGSCPKTHSLVSVPHVG